jgi:hypothetical protein
MLWHHFENVFSGSWQSPPPMPVLREPLPRESQLGQQFIGEHQLLTNLRFEETRHLGLVIDPSGKVFQFISPFFLMTETLLFCVYVVAREIFFHAAFVLVNNTLPTKMVRKWHRHAN